MKQKTEIKETKESSKAELEKLIEKKVLLSKSELSIWLDSYDDIYSDFDSRQYLKRRVSEDFLYELKNAFRYKKEKINDLVRRML